MSIIDYNDYLDGDEWPSESAKAVVNEFGQLEPEMKPVIDMPPQYAAAALHKLVRWAKEGALSFEQEDEYERRARGSTLGRLLARRALGIEDFELYQEHGIERRPLSAHELSRAIVWRLMHPEDGLVDMAPSTAAKLSEGLAMTLIDHGYTVYKEGE